MAVVGRTFETMAVSSKTDGAFYRSMHNDRDGILRGCLMSTSGAEVTISTGSILACGRVVDFTSDVVVSLANPAWPTMSMVAQIYLKIDLSLNNTGGTFLQGAILTRYSPIGSPFVSTQQDLNVSGTIYELPICEVNMDSGIISSTLVSKLTVLGKAIYAIGTLANDVSNSVGAKMPLVNSNVNGANFVNGALIVPKGVSMANIAFGIAWVNVPDTGICTGYLKINGVTAPLGTPYIASREYGTDTPMISACSNVKVSEGDSIELWAGQSSGSAKLVGKARTHLSVIFYD